MKPWLLSLWNDPAKFTAMCRGIIATIGGMYAAGVIPQHVVPWWVGLVIMGLSQGISAGQTNPKLSEQVSKLDADERTRVGNMLKP